MKEKIASKGNTGKPEYLSTEFASELLEGSFLFSQGSEMEQCMIFGYIHAARPSWRVQYGEDAAREIADATKAKILPVLMPDNGVRRHPPLSGDASTLDWPLFKMVYGKPGQFTAMEGFLASTHKGDEEKYVPNLTWGLVKRDHKFIVENEAGRPRTNPSDTDPSRDPFLSHIVHYGILGNPTGQDVFDEMFTDVAEYLKTVKKGQTYPRYEDDFPHKLAEVLGKYVEKHAGFSLPPEYQHLLDLKENL